jgi:ribosome recycling factor
MVPLQNLYRDVEDKMKRAVANVTRELAEIRGGRATTSMLDHVTVEYYGTATPIKTVAAVTSPEVNMLVIQPWDAKLVQEIEKAIQKAEIGITPVIDGKIVRLPIPPLTGERREELTKVVHRMAEEGRVTVRTLRRDANEAVKKLKAEKQISEDDAFKAQDHVQKLTDCYIESINSLVKSKEQELHSV